MTNRKEQHEKVRGLLKRAVTSLCWQGLGSASRFIVEALIGITLQDGDVMLISINETVDNSTVSPELMDYFTEDLPSSDGPDDQPWPQKKHPFSRPLKSGNRRKRERSQKTTISNHCHDYGSVMPRSKTETGKSATEEVKDDNLSNDDNDEIPGEGKSYQALDSSDECFGTVTSDKQSTMSDSMDGLPENTAQAGNTLIPHVGPYKCTQCDVVYKYRKCLVEHYTKAHQKVEEKVPESQDWHCQVCNRVFPSKRSLTRHIIVHSDDRQRYKCHICSKTFSCKRHVDFHISTVHQGHYPFVCDLCGKQVTTKAALEGHMASKHSINKVKCEKCNREYARPAALASHVCTDKPPRFEETICHICKKSFDLPKRLIQHMAKHLEPRYQCEQCGRNFKWASSLQAHKVAAHTLEDSKHNQQQQTKQEEHSYAPEQNTLLEPLHSQTVQSQEESALALNSMSMFTQPHSSHHPQLSDQTTRPEQVLSDSSSLPVQVSHSHMIEAQFSHPHNQSVTEVLSSSHPFLSELSSSASHDMNHVHAAWQAAFINQSDATAVTQIQPSPQQ